MNSAPAAPKSKASLRKKLLLGAVAAAGVVFIAIQFVPVKGIGSNPPERHQLDAPADVQAILRRACMDCHSHETRWPIYARVAPGSWLMAKDVNKGRSRFNMSEWGDSDEAERKLDKETAWEQIEAGNMPPTVYIIPFHLDARLSPEDKAKLKSWLLAGGEKKEGEKKDEEKKEEEKKP
jgi:hypothetical protein